MVWRRHRRAAAELAAETEAAGPHRRRHRGRRVPPVVGDETVGHPHRLHQGHRPRLALRVRNRLDQRADQVVHAGAAGMDVEQHVVARQDVVLDIVGDPLRRPAGGIAGKGPVEVTVVEGRAALGRHHRRQVGRRQDRDAAAYRFRLEQPDQLEQSQLALVFVAVVAGHQHDARAVAVGDPADRNLDLVVGRAVDRIGKADEADLLAVRIPGNVAIGAGVHYAKVSCRSDAASAVGLALTGNGIGSERA